MVCVFGVFCCLFVYLVVWLHVFLFKELEGFCLLLVCILSISRLVSRICG